MAVIMVRSDLADRRSLPCAHPGRHVHRKPVGLTFVCVDPHTRRALRPQLSVLQAWYTAFRSSGSLRFSAPCGIRVVYGCAFSTPLALGLTRFSALPGCFSDIYIYSVQRGVLHPAGVYGARPDHDVRAQGRHRLHCRAVLQRGVGGFRQGHRHAAGHRRQCGRPNCTVP